MCGFTRIAVAFPEEILPFLYLQDRVEWKQPSIGFFQSLYLTWIKKKKNLDIPLDKKQLDSSSVRVTGQSFSGTIFDNVKLYPGKISTKYKNPIKNFPFTSYKNPHSLKKLSG